MRNFTLTAFLIFACSCLQAQFNPGNKLIGGNLYFSTGSNSNSSAPNTQQNSNGGLDISLMRFRTATLLGGGGLSFGYTRSHYTGGLPFADYTNTGYNLGVFCSRIKLQPLSAKFYLSFTGTLGAQYGFGRADNNTIVGYDRFRSYSAYLSGAMGIWYRLNNRLLFSCDLNNLLHLGYSHTTTDSHSGSTSVTNKQSGFNFRTGLGGFSLNSLGVGLRYQLK